MKIKLKLDLTKVDKAKLFKSEKTGSVYLDVMLIENKNGVDQYGNSFMAVQDVSKEEREAGIKGAILGNGKIVGGAGQPAQAARPAAKIQPKDVTW